MILRDYHRARRRASFAALPPLRPAVTVSLATYAKVRAYAHEQGITMQRALDRAMASVLSLHSVRGVSR